MAGEGYVCYLDLCNVNMGVYICLNLSNCPVSISIIFLKKLLFIYFLLGVLKFQPITPVEAEGDDGCINGRRVIVIKLRGGYSGLNQALMQ